MKDFRNIILTAESETFDTKRALEIIEKAETEIEAKIKKDPFSRYWEYCYSRAGLNKTQLRYEYKELLKHSHTTQLEIQFVDEYDGPGPNYSPAKIRLVLERSKCLSSGE